MVETPERYRRFLEQQGGLNPYGEPNFILIWGRSPIYRLGIPDTFIAPYLNAWCLAEWKPAEEFGSPDDWDEQMWGSYPNRGLYIPIQVFKDDGEPILLDTERLNIGVLEMFLWVILHHEHDSLLQRATFLKDQMAQAKAAQTQQLIDRIEDGAPAFLDGVSFSGQLNCNSVVRQKIEQLERNFSRITDVASRFKRGGIVQQSI